MLKQYFPYCFFNFIEFGQVSNDTNLTQLEELDYTYDTSWKDQLTEYEGYEYTYDEIGNPTLIEKDEVTYQTFTWEKGRQLKSMYIKRDHLGEHDLDIYYKYNDNGIRTEKKVVDKTTLVETITTYKVQGNKIIEEITGSDKIHYIYDAEGSVVAFKYYEDTYYYKRNITGDVIGIIDETGAQVVTYKYNSWGEIESIADSSSNDIGTVNRVRYKGYYYDSETKLYYLNSRYYNPETKRMLNADGYISTGVGFQGHNMYAYANNNPIILYDPNGEFVLTATAVSVLASLILLTAAVYILPSISIPAPDLSWTNPLRNKLEVPELSEEYVDTGTMCVPVTYDEAMSLTSKPINDSAIVYRWGSRTDKNFTPRFKDKDGLSFYNYPSPFKNQVTTVGQIKSLGVFNVTIRGGHISVKPMDGTLADWARYRNNSGLGTHPYTDLIRSITWEVKF